MNFILFLVLNAILLLRPEELYPEIEGLRLYLIAICACTFASLPKLLPLLTFDSLARRPTSVCVLLFFASTIITMIVHGEMESAFTEFGPEFAKVLLFYFLLIANVDSEGKFRSYVAALICIVTVLSALAIGQLYGWVNFQNIRPLGLPITNEFGEVVDIHPDGTRIVATGIFGDPNDLCLILGLAIVACMYLATTRNSDGQRFPLWLLLIPYFIFAVLETNSRGGLLGVLVGIAGYFFSRFGGPKSVPYVVAGGIAALLIIGGRQSSLTGSDTGHERVMMWADGLTNLFRQPLYLPIGLGTGWFVQENGLLAHNSFIQAYVENGILGGGAFFGVFAISAIMIYRIGGSIEAENWVIQAKHFGFAILVGYAGGCYSLTRNYVVPTYLVLGLAAALLDQIAETLPEQYVVNRQWFIRACLISAVGLVVIKLATQGLGLLGV